MRCDLLRILGLFCGLLMAAMSLMAHHSIAGQYDTNRPVTLMGTVTKLEWMNPHIYFYIDVKDSAGKVTNWNLELASPSILVRNGWTRHSVKEGDMVTVTGSRARDNSNFGIAQTIVFPDGRKLNFLSAFEAGQ